MHKVERKATRKLYALKQVKLRDLPARDQDNAVTEVRLLASLKSNFIVKYHEAFFDFPTQQLCIVMDFADDGDVY